MEKAEKAEFYIMAITIAFGAIISILDLTDSLDEIIWLKNRISTITLLLLTFVAGSFLFSTYNTRRILKSVLPLGTITKFDSGEELIHYTLKRMREAKKSICDLTLEKSIKNIKSPFFYSDEDREKYLITIEEVSIRVQYREIILFNNESRISKAKRLISKAGKYYQLAGYANLPVSSPSIWNYVIIDDEIIFSKGLVVRQSEIVEYFRTNFDDLWDTAISVKIGGKVISENLKKFEELLEKMPKVDTEEYDKI